VIRAQLAVLLCFLAAGCGGEAGARPAPRAHVVEIRGFAFAPARLNVAEGDTVVWRNADIVPHTATAAPGFDSGSIAAGGEWRWVATAGDYSYLCSFHPTMRGDLSVAKRE
jgi:plastocyanin